MGHLEVARVVEGSGSAGVEFIKAAVVGKFAAVDEHLRAGCGVDGRKNDVGGIFAAAHHEAALWDHEGVELVDAHVAGINVGQKVLEGFAFGVFHVVLELGEKGDGGHYGLVVEFRLLPRLLAESALAEHGFGGERFCKRSALECVGDERCDIGAV